MFWLTPQVMQFSGAYLASNGVAEAARPVIRALTESVGESSSVAVLDGLDVVYIVRVETRRISRPVSTSARGFRPIARRSGAPCWPA